MSAARAPARRAGAAICRTGGERWLEASPASVRLALDLAQERLLAGRQRPALEPLQLVARQPADLLAVPRHRDMRPRHRSDHVLEALVVDRRALGVRPQ